MKDRLTILSSFFRTKRHQQFTSRAQLERWQDGRVQQFLQKILPKSPFYQRQFDSIDLENWQQAPIIEKADMMDHFDDLNTVGISKERAFEVAIKAEQSRDFSPKINGITVGLSSGTSGNRGLFLVSDQERLRWAGTVLAKVLPGPLWQKQRIAFFLRANSNLYGSVTSSTIQFAYFDLLDSLEKHLERLNQFQPTILTAPPSMLRFLAEAKQQDKLDIGPKKIISVAEVLDPLDESFIEKIFEQTIHQVYQCTEGFLACTCEHGTLHLNEDVVVIQKQYLDESLKKFSPIITDFNRISQPIIRYRLNDILTERTEPCPCGSVMTALESIEGRCDDLFHLKSKQTGELVPVFPDFIRRAVIGSSNHIEAYRVQQLAPDEINVFVKTTVDVIQDLEKTFSTLWQRLDCDPPRITVEVMDQELPQAKKLKRVERCFSLDELSI